MRIVDRIKDKFSGWTATTVYIKALPPLKRGGLPLSYLDDRFDFIVNGARFVVYARDEELAWAVARRITNDNRGLRRLA